MALIVITQWKSVYNAVIGTERCVVAADYHSLTYMGNEYIPLPMNGCECVIGDQILSEVRVEGVGFLSKIFAEGQGRTQVGHIQAMQNRLTVSVRLAFIPVILAIPVTV